MNGLLSSLYWHGKYKKDKTRPIAVKFHHPLDRDHVWKKRNELKSKIKIRGFFPHSTRKNRSILQEIFNLTQSLPNYQGKVYLSDDNLVINGTRYTISELDQIPIDSMGMTGAMTVNNKMLFYGFSCPITILANFMLMVSYSHLMSNITIILRHCIMETTLLHLVSLQRMILLQ